MVKHSLILSALIPALLLAACSRESTDGSPIGNVTQAASQVLQDESDDNDTSAAATPLLIDGNGVAVVRANILPMGEVDFYSFSASAGDKIYAGTMTSWSADGTIPDSVLALLGTDGNSVIESDDDEGSFSNYSSSLAGVPIPANGTYFLKVTPINSTTALRPYDLHVQRRSGAPTAETEDNGASAQNLPASHWVSGALSVAADTDNFLFSANAGDTVYLSLDLDPERDGGDWDGMLMLSSFGSTPTALTARNSSLRSDSYSEALYVTVNETGDYWAGVASGNASAIGTYNLSVTVDPKAGDPVGSTCTTYTSTDVPITIPAGPSNVESEIVVPSGAGRVATMEVGLNIDHNRMADLNVSLTAPDGNTIGLFNSVGSTVAGVQTTMNLVIDDTAATPVNALGNTVTRMRAQPTSAHRLEWFNGQSISGTWTLNVADAMASNDGSIVGWSLRVCTLQALTSGCPGGTERSAVLSEDFEASDGDFVHTGAVDEWEYGTPSFAPITSCASGTKCWKTDLDATYAASSNASLISPVIDLSNAAGTLIVTWQQKSNIESAIKDQATVAIREGDNSNSTTLWTWTGGSGATSTGEAAGWGRHQAFASGYTGADAELVFNLTTDASIQWAGLAIDDVTVTACVYVCGDGAQLGAEECDDGNIDNGDGCDENCQEEGPVPEGGVNDGGATDGGSNSGADAAAGGNAGSPSGGNGGTPTNGDDAGNSGGNGTGGVMSRPPVDFPDTAGTGGTAGASATAGPSEDSGCGCKLAGRSSHEAPWSALALVALFGATATRRRKRI